MRKELFIDIETNDSLDSKTGVITQIGYIYRVDGKLKEEKNINNHDNHNRNLYRTFTSCLDKMVNKYNKDDKLYFIAYNARFDNDFIREMFLQNNDKYFGSYFYSPYLCIMNLAAFKYQRKGRRPENFKLGTVCKDMGIKVDDTKLHDALYDIKLSKELYNKLIKFK